MGVFEHALELWNLVGYGTGNGQDCSQGRWLRGRSLVQVLPGAAASTEPSPLPDSNHLYSCVKVGFFTNMSINKLFSLSGQPEPS